MIPIQHQLESTLPESIKRLCQILTNPIQEPAMVVLLAQKEEKRTWLR